MPSKLNIQGQSIPFRVSKGRGRRIVLRFSMQEPILEIRTPNGRFGGAERQAIAKQENWILRQYQEKQGLWQRRDLLRQEIVAGQIPYLGQSTPIQYLPAKKSRITVTAEGIQLYLGPSDWDRDRMPMLYHGMRTLAAGILKPKVRHWAAQTQSKVNQIRVKDVRSRWGSCSSKSNINLNWHLIMVTPALIDYLIIHELMHLREMNHGPDYWTWVEKYYPDYRQADKALTAQEWMIGIFDYWLAEAPD